MSKETFLREKADSIPLAPGCYMFVAEDGSIMYVGKSKCLRKRVSSYFGAVKEEKFEVMRMFAKDILTQVTGTDIEALILEHQLIKKHRPPYNAKMRKDYGAWYIKFDKDIYITAEYGDGGFTAGPFSHRDSAQYALQIMGAYWKLPTCGKKNDKSHRMCLRGHTNDCYAPCMVHMQTETEAQKQGNTTTMEQSVNEAIGFIQGNTSGPLGEIELKMHEAAEKQEYEKAAKLRNLHGELRRLADFFMSSAPKLGGKEFLTILKSHHEDCFMVCYIRDGGCLAKTIIRDFHKPTIESFAKNITNSRHKIDAAKDDENKSFMRALIEIDAKRRFYEVDDSYDIELVLAGVLKQFQAELPSTKPRAASP